jgi:Periplasmic copper-binding protein (NosD)
MKRIAAVIGTLAALVVTAPAQSATWIVDGANPEVECQNADSATIEEAVALAASGDTVRVCPGSYPETVVVDKPLRLEGAGPDPQARSSDPTQEAVVEPVGALGFVLGAPEIVLEGFTIRAASIGVRVERFSSGHLIRRNLFGSNSTGLQMASDGTLPSVVQANVFRANVRFAIFNNVTAGPLENAVIETNEFDSDESAISLTGQVVDVSIDKNNFFGHRLSGVFVNGARIEITNNTFEDVTQSIRVSGFQPNRVAHNDVLRGRVNGIVFFAGLNAVVEFNRVAQATGDGIGLQNFIGGEVRGNDVEASGRHGIHLFNGSRESAVEVNRSDGNGVDGIRVDETSSVNRINNNRFDANGEHDCHDDSIGPGTGGTRNFWEHNHGDTANRPEICKPTGQSESEPALWPAAATAFTVEPPCMPFTQARETEIDSPAWDGAPWICDPTSDELEPAPEA